MNVVLFATFPDVVDPVRGHDGSLLLHGHVVLFAAYNLIMKKYSHYADRRLAGFSTGK